MNKQVKKRRSAEDIQIEQLEAEAVYDHHRTRNRDSGDQGRPPSLKQRRAFEMFHIGRLIRDHQVKLLPFKDIMEAILEGKVSVQIKKLTNCPDFTDGFVMRDGQ